MEVVNSFPVDLMIKLNYNMRESIVNIHEVVSSFIQNTEVSSSVFKTIEEFDKYDIELLAIDETFNVLMMHFKYVFPGGVLSNPKKSYRELLDEADVWQSKLKELNKESKDIYNLDIGYAFYKHYTELEDSATVEEINLSDLQEESKKDYLKYGLTSNYKESTTFMDYLFETINTLNVNNKN